MLKNSNDRTDSETLRQKAEELLKKKATGSASSLSEIEMLKLIHELEVHQIELEMQNEELIHAYDVSMFDLKKKNDESLEQQALFTSALDAIADVILYNEEPEDILENANRILGQTLQLDRSVIYQVSFEKNQITGLCEWLQTTSPEITSTIGNYPFDWFRCPLSELKKTQNYLISQFNAVNEHFIEDGSGIKLHQGMNIKSLLWYPFDFDEHMFYVFTLNQVLKQRQWTNEDISFVSSVAKQVSIALLKIRLLNEHQLVKESEEKLKVLSDQLESILDHIPGLVFYKDKKNNFIRVNKYFADAIHKNKHELTNVNLADIYPASIAGQYHQDDLSVINSGLAKLNIEEIWETEEGLKWVNTSKIPFIDANGEIIGVIGISMDITERRKAEQSLRESELRFRNLFDKANEGLVMLSIDGKLVEVNESFADMHGYTVEELKNTNIQDIDVLREGSFEGRADIMKRINAGEVVRFEVEHYHKDGHSIIFSDTVSLITIGDQKFYLAFHQDITERKQAEIALQKSEELYRKLLHTIPDIIVMTDIEGNITYASDKMDSFLDNVPKENIYGKNMLSFIAEHDLPRAIENTKLMLNNALGVREYQLKFPNNTIIDAEINGDIIRDRENNPLGIVFIIRNITERKRLEEEKRKTDSKILTLSMAIDQSPVTTVITDLAGNIEFVNPKFTETTGYKAEEAIGKNSRILKSGDKPDTEYKELWDTILSGQNWHGVFQNKRKNGELYWESAVISSVKDNEGAITHFLAVKEDITQRKQMVEELKQISTRLSLATSAGGVGVWDYDIVNNVMLWDDQMIALYGLDKNSFSGAYEAWRAGLHPDDMVRGDQEIQMAISGKKDFNTEFRVLWPDGTVRYIRALAIVQRDGTGKALRMIGTNWDITNQKNTEQALLESKDILQKNNAEKDKFFSIIAHDLRSPFNVFLNFSQMLAEDLPTLEQEQIQRIAVSMQNSATNLFRLLENLLEWSLMQRGITQYEPETCILMTEISESMTSVIDPAKKKGIQIIYDIPEDIVVFADENMLHGIIRNLATNAVKFTPKAGTITIAAKQLPDKSVEISIKDTGIGMSREMIDDLFKLDVNTSRRGTEDEPSTGLGLIICKDFIGKHDGKFWVESEEGKGSVFYFTIPYNAEVQNRWNEPLGKPTLQVPRQTGNLPEEIKPLKILIAEDDEISDSLISDIVKKYSHEILHVKTGVQAIAAFLSNPDIDLVLMDINLPQMDGYEATRQIRRFNKDVIIIAQTAYALLGDRQIAIDSGCNDYISKPIAKDELLGLIRKYFNL